MDLPDQVGQGRPGGLEVDFPDRLPNERLARFVEHECALLSSTRPRLDGADGAFYAVRCDKPVECGATDPELPGNVGDIGAGEAFVLMTLK